MDTSDNTTLPEGKRCREPLPRYANDVGFVEIGSLDSNRKYAKSLIAAELNHVDNIIDELIALPNTDGLKIEIADGDEQRYAYMEQRKIYHFYLRFGDMCDPNDIRTFRLMGLKQPHIFRARIDKKAKYSKHYTSFKVYLSEIEPRFIWKILDVYDKAKKPKATRPKKKAKIDDGKVVEISKSDPRNEEIIKTLVDRWSPVVKEQIENKMVSSLTAATNAEISLKIYGAIYRLEGDKIRDSVIQKITEEERNLRLPSTSLNKIEK